MINFRIWYEIVLLICARDDISWPSEHPASALHGFCTPFLSEVVHVPVPFVRNGNKSGVWYFRQGIEL
jgi:hypothetical protein